MTSGKQKELLKKPNNGIRSHIKKLINCIPVLSQKEATLNLSYALRINLSTVHITESY